MACQHRGRSDGSRCEIATTIRTDTVQNGVGTGRAESALVATDARIGRVRREIAVAALAIRAKFQQITLQIIGSGC